MNTKLPTTAASAAAAVRIGEFSQLAQVSVRTLRHYDELGLLKPARIDRFTDYRYYSVEQLSRLNRILVLKDLGFSLEQIAHVLKDDVSAEQLRGMLLMKRAELERELLEEQARLRRVEARVRHIEQEGKPPDYEIVLKRIERQVVASTRQIIPTLEQMDVCRQPMYDALYQWLARHGIEPLEPEYALYHADEYRDHDIDMEAAVAVSEAVLNRFANDPQMRDSRFGVRELPAEEQMASAIHQGDHPDVVQAFSALILWVCENGYRPAGVFRELHLFGRETESYRKVIIEVQVPVKHRELN